MTIGENAIVGAGSVVTQGCSPERDRRGESRASSCGTRATRAEGDKIDEPNQIRFLFSIWSRPHAELERRAARRCFATGSADRRLSSAAPWCEDFERDFAAFCDAKYCVGVGSGTDALRFALMAAGVDRGDIVVTVPNTFIATTEAISQAGAAPDFVDIDERTYNMDPDKLREYLEERCVVDAAHRQADRSRNQDAR